MVFVSIVFLERISFASIGTCRRISPRLFGIAIDSLTSVRLLRLVSWFVRCLGQAASERPSPSVAASRSGLSPSDAASPAESAAGGVAPSPHRQRELEAGVPSLRSSQAHVRDLETTVVKLAALVRGPAAASGSSDLAASASSPAAQ